MKRILLFINLLLGVLFSAQLSRDKLELIQPLAKLDYAESSSVGIVGEDSKIYLCFQKIKNKLTNEELLILSKNSSNCLRLYSCFELIARNELLIVSIYEYYRQFPLKMMYTQGCVGSIVDIAEMIFKEYENVFEIKKYAEKELKKIPESNSEYKTWEKVLREKEKQINPDFIEAFERIKKIKTVYDMK